MTYGRPKEEMSQNKICILCGTDCVSKPRHKDPEVQYVCRECYEAPKSQPSVAPQQDPSQDQVYFKANERPNRPRQSGRPPEKGTRGTATRWGPGGLSLAITGCLVVGGIVWLGFGNRSRGLEAQIQTHLNAIEAAEQPVTPVDPDSWYRRPRENGATLYLEAFQKIDMDNGGGLVSKDRPLNRADFIVLGHVVRHNEDALDLLHKGASVPEEPYPIDFTNRLFELSHLSPLKNAIQLLRLEAAFYAANHARHRAADSIIAQLALCRSLKLEPAAIFQLVRFPGSKMTQHTAQLVFEAGLLSANSLSKLDTALGEAVDLGGSQRALIGERALRIHRFQNPEQYPDEVVTGYTFTEEKHTAERVSLPKGGAWKRNFVFYLENHANLLDRMGKQLQERRAAVEVLERTIGQPNNNDPLFFAKDALAAYPSLLEKEALGIAALRTARIAIAIEQFRASQGTLPNSLQELMPTYLKTLPRNPFGQDLIQYKPLQRGYVAYSVGKDGRNQNEGIYTMADDTNDIAFYVKH